MADVAAALTAIGMGHRFSWGAEFRNFRQNPAVFDWRS
jgi:hypothetical protein